MLENIIDRLTTLNVVSVVIKPGIKFICVQSIIFIITALLLLIVSCLTLWSFIDKALKFKLITVYTVIISYRNDRCRVRLDIIKYSRIFDIIYVHRLCEPTIYT